MERLVIGVDSCVDSVAVIRLRGWVDASTVPAMQTVLQDLVERGHYHLVMDIGEVECMDSAGFGTLLGALRSLRDRNGSISLVSPRDPVRRALRITRLDTALKVYESEAEAVGAITGT